MSAPLKVAEDIAAGKLSPSLEDKGNDESARLKTVALAKQYIGGCLMQQHNWRLSYQLNEGLAPAVAEEKLNAVSGIS